MRWNFWLNRLQCSNSEASSHSQELSTWNLHNLYLFLDMSHELKTWLAEHTQVQIKCSNSVTCLGKRASVFSRFTKTISHNEYVIRKSLLCSATSKLLVSHVCFSVTSKEDPVWLIQSCFNERKLKVFQRIKRTKSCGKAGSLQQHSTQVYYQRENADKYWR